MKFIFLFLLWYMACPSNTPTGGVPDAALLADGIDTPVVKIQKSMDDWRKELSPLEFTVLREKGTERAFTGDLWDHHEKGVYTCRGCQLPLFQSATKFDSGTGWPSFFKPISKTHVDVISDLSHGMNRTEVVCGRCGGHLGHVFDDGPKPTGLRYCMNSVSLDFVPEKK
jgi:peptide-methionine (R)-S-oxide reductase